MTSHPMIGALVSVSVPNGATRRATLMGFAVEPSYDEQNRQDFAYVAILLADDGRLFTQGLDDVTVVEVPLAIADVVADRISMAELVLALRGAETKPRMLDRCAEPGCGEMRQSHAHIVSHPFKERP